MDEYQEKIARALTAVQSPKKMLRCQGEEFLRQESVTNTNNYTLALARILASSQESDAKSLAALMMRKLAKTDDRGDAPLKHLAEETVTKLKQGLLTICCQEADNRTRKQVAEAIIEFATFFEKSNLTKWDNLWPMLFELYSQKQPGLKCTALLIIGRLNESSSLRTHLGKVFQIYEDGLQCSDDAVQIAALSAMAQTMTVLETKDTFRLRPIIPTFMQMLGKTITNKEWMKVESILTAVNEVLMTHTEFFAVDLDRLTEVMAQICSFGDAVSEDVRQLALEFLVATTEGIPAYVRANPKVVETILRLCFNFMTQLNDDLVAWCSNIDNEDDDETLKDAGEGALDRVAQALTGPHIEKVISPILAEFVSKNDWKSIHAALMAINQIAEVMKWEKFERCMEVVINFLEHDHPRVRFAAVNVLGQVSVDHGDNLRLRYGTKITPYLCKILAEEGNPRLQAHACGALINLFEVPDGRTENLEMQRKILAPYLEPLLSKCFDILSTTTAEFNHLQGQVVTTIASLADCSQDVFVKYFDTVTPNMFKIITNPKPDSSKVMGRAIECLSFIGKAVGRDRFREFGGQFMERTICMAESQECQEDSSLMSYIVASWGRVCTVMKDDFRPFLKPVMQVMNVWMGQKCRVSQQDVDNDVNGLADEFEVYTDGKTTIYIDRNKIEVKSTTIQTLRVMSEVMGGSLFPFLKDIIYIIFPLIMYPYDDQIRSLAILCMPSLVDVGLLARNEEAVKFFKMVIMKVTERLKVETTLHVIICLVQVLEVCFKKSHELVNSFVLEQINTVIGDLFGFINNRAERIQQREQTRKETKYFDQVDLAHLQEENALEDQLLLDACNIITNLVEILKDKFILILENHRDSLARMLTDPNSTGKMKRTSIFVFDDVVEHLSPTKLTNLVQQFIPLLLSQGTAHEDANVRQATFFGLGVFAKRFALEQFEQFAAGICKACVQEMQRSMKGESEAVINARDNAISALCKVFKYKSNTKEVDVNQLLQIWIKALPVREDFEEAMICHRYILSLLNSSNYEAVLGGPGWPVLPNVLFFLATIKDSTFWTEDIRTEYTQFVKKIKQVNKDHTFAAVNRLSGKLQKKLAG